jgi:PAS domain S-box-containing protein
MATERDEAGVGGVDPGVVFESSPDAILLTESRTGEVLDVNEAAVDLFGQPRERLREETLGDLCQNHEEATAVLQETVDGADARREWELAQADGSRWVDVTVEPADGDGRALVFLRDLTERRDLELDLRRERGLTERVLDTTPTGIVVHDSDGEITMANTRAEEILGVDRVDLVERTHDDDVFQLRDVDDEWLPDSETPFARIAEHGEAITGEQVVVDTPDGDRVLSVSGAPLWDDADEFDGAVMSVQDVTSEFEIESRVREQKEHLETVMEHLPVVLFAIDDDGTFTLSRGRGLESLGLEPGELNGVSLFDAYADSPDIIEACERALDGEEVRVRQAVGDLTFDTQYRPVTNEQGEVEQVIGVSLDITEQQEYERRLEENDAILTQLTETTDDIFWLFDGDFTEVLFVNDAYEDIWGRSAAAAEEDPMDFIKGVHPDDRDIVAGAIEDLRAGQSTEHEYRVNADEDYGRWVWVRGEPITDEEGNVQRVAGFARDITERKEREQQLERSERQFEAVFNDPQLLVALLDTDGTVRHINETALDHAAAGRDTVEGMAFAETSWWSHDEELQADLREWIRRAADGKYVEYEAEHPLPSGGTMAVSGTIRPVTDDEGAVRSLIASARDVTERREHQRQLEESNERLERFAYVASHDLQEPLRTISNYVELIAEEYGEDLDDDAEQFIDVVTTGSERMQSMINGLLDYSRVTTRGDEFEPVDAEAVAADVADDLTIMLDEEDGTMTWGDLPTVTADGDQLRQVVQNLVKNALEHSGGEPVEVEIRGRDVGDAYRFAVADDGPGIEPNRQEKIFRIFKSGKQYQTSSQAKGIGLAICDNIVQRHGGDIWVESEPGDGATFVFTIDKDQ